MPIPIIIPDFIHYLEWGFLAEICPALKSGVLTCPIEYKRLE